MIERFLHGLAEKMEDPDNCSFITVVIPGDIDPFERHFRSSVHLDTELRLANLGCGVGGGTLYYEPHEDSERDTEIAYCILDVDAVNVEGARSLLRTHLPELGAPEGTLVQFGEREDRFDGSIWRLDQPSSIEE